MPCCKRDNNSEKRINAVIDKILKKDKRRNRKAKKSRKEKTYICPSNTEKCQIVKNKESNNGIESSTRFSIRVMEAMRSLQRKTSNRSMTSSKIKDIVKYIEINYRFDGDLDAQVRTDLSRICRQGFIMKNGKEDYHLVGPFASYLNNVDNDQITNSLIPCKKKCKSRSISSKSGCCDNFSKKRKSKKGKDKGTKVIRDPGSKDQDEDINKNQDGNSCNQDEDPSKNCSNNKDELQSTKSKNLKKKKRSRCGCSYLDKEKFNENQSESSTISFKTCCEEFSPENSTIGKQIFESGPSNCEGSSRKIDKKIRSSSGEENSEDSVYQELKKKNSKKLGYNNKELKRWIKRCRWECSQD